MSTKEPMFPILGDDILRAVPWAMLEKHEAQAKSNHGQDLYRLAERGGLAPSEAWAAYHDKPLTFPNAAQAVQYRILFMRDVAAWLSDRAAREAQAEFAKTTLARKDAVGVLVVLVALARSLAIGPGKIEEMKAAAKARSPAIDWDSLWAEAEAELAK